MANTTQMLNTVFRTCPDTGLKFHGPAENLIKANAVAAVVFLLNRRYFWPAGGLTRWQAVHLLGAEDFYLVLTAHGLKCVLIFWLIFLKSRVLYFCSAVYWVVASRHPNGPGPGLR